MNIYNCTHNIALHWIYINAYLYSMSVSYQIGIRDAYDEWEKLNPEWRGQSTNSVEHLPMRHDYVDADDDNDGRCDKQPQYT